MTSNSDSKIQASIYIIRGQKVMLDFELADLYGVKTKVLNQAVARNRQRFPEDFTFQLTEYERDKLMRSQFVTASQKKANLRFLPFAFTKLGIAMLSGVLKTEQAILVHISIIRVFFKLREANTMNNEFIEKMENLESSANQLFKIVFERLDSLEAKEIDIPPKRRIGF